MSHVYRVTVPATTVWVEADNKAQARSIALRDITIVKLDAGGIIELHRRGEQIISPDSAPEPFDKFVQDAGLADDAHGGIIDPTRSGIDLPPITSEG